MPAKTKTRPQKRSRPKLTAGVKPRSKSAPAGEVDPALVDAAYRVVITGRDVGRTYSSNAVREAAERLGRPFDMTMITVNRGGTRYRTNKDADKVDAIVDAAYAKEARLRPLLTAYAKAKIQYHKRGTPKPQRDMEAALTELQKADPGFRDNTRIGALETWPASAYEGYAKQQERWAKHDARMATAKAEREAANPTPAAKPKATKKPNIWAAVREFQAEKGGDAFTWNQQVAAVAGKTGQSKKAVDKAFQDAMRPQMAQEALTQALQGYEAADGYKGRNIRERLVGLYQRGSPKAPDDFIDAVVAEALETERKHRPLILAYYKEDGSVDATPAAARRAKAARAKLVKALPAFGKIDAGFLVSAEARYVRNTERAEAKAAERASKAAAKQEKPKPAEQPAPMPKSRRKAPYVRPPADKAFLFDPQGRGDGFFAVNRDGIFLAYAGPSRGPAAKHRYEVNLNNSLTALGGDTIPIWSGDSLAEAKSVLMSDAVLEEGRWRLKNRNKYRVSVSEFESKADVQKKGQQVERQRNDRLRKAVAKQTRRRRRLPAPITEQEMVDMAPPEDRRRLQRNLNKDQESRGEKPTKPGHPLPPAKSTAAVAPRNLRPVSTPELTAPKQRRRAAAGRQPTPAGHLPGVSITRG